MRITMLAVMLDSRSRSANIARALTAIDQAAATDPAPELVVVPVGCDHAQQPDNSLTPAMIQMYAAALSLKAREWGVLIAAGRLECGSGGPVDIGVMLDADGDERGRTPAGFVSPEPFDTVYGPVRLIIESESLLETVEADPWTDTNLTIVLGRPADARWSPGGDRRTCDRIAAATASDVYFLRAAADADEGTPGVAASEQAPAATIREVPGGRLWSVETNPRPAAKRVQ